MNQPTQLIVPALSSPFGTILGAVGIATWLERLILDLTGSHTEVEIANRGDSIVVSASATLTAQDVQVDHYARPIAWILTAKNGPPPKDLPRIDYEAERQHNADYYERLKTYQKAGISIGKLDPEQQNELKAMAPHPYWPVVAVINQMGALGAYNKAVERWAACRPVYPELAAIIWTMCSGESRALERAQAQWEALAKQHGLDKNPLLPAPQVVNPEQGKGANRPKADALTIGGQESFWLLEYFKFAGLYQAALPRTVQGKKDRKTYVVLPAREGITLHWHQLVFGQFQQQFWSNSAIKMDVQAVLRYTATMLAQWQGAQRSRGRRRRASDFIAGFIVASFKDLGSAVAVMNVATLRLPDWVEWPADPERASMLGAVITEHQLLTGALDEKKGEEEQLLRNYRDFLSSRDPSLRAFFDFTTAYAGHTISKMSRREPVRRFTLDNLEVIMMANDERRREAQLPPLSKIVETHGFRNIATAIRRSTVIPQFHKVKGNTPYDVRYGLADELRRKARRKDEFIVALSEFMQQYNQENKRVYARERGPVRADITTQDITDIVRLIDEYSSSTVANLLIAFGYARDPKAPSEDGASGDINDQTDLPVQDETAEPQE